MPKKYSGRIPACGCFCGGCPNYVRERNTCPGAEINTERCAKCTRFHLCCKEKKITHCHECEEFPCIKMKRFAKTWLKYGQDFLENQALLKEIGEEEFRRIWNKKAA